MKTLCETDVNLFTKEVDEWQITNSKLKDIRSKTEIENSTQPKLILLTTETETFYLKKWDWVPAPHKYVIGSLKFCYSDDDFSDGSTLTLDIFVAENYRETVEELGKPCFTMKIPQPQKQIQSNFAYAYFGEIHHTNELEIVMKVQVHYNGNQKIKKPKSFSLRDVKLYLSPELSNITHSSVECPLGQGLNENLVCQDCAANCDACFGPKPSQCLSCSAGSHWHGLGCTTCHDNCDKCSGPTQYECLGCNVQSFDYRNGTCSEWCGWPFESSEKSCLKACKSDEYTWKPNYLCLARCPAPLISFTDNNGILICENPCWNSENFLYTNGSCISVCPAPFAAEFSLEGKFCKNPCKSTSEYTFPNGSCLKECLPPLKVRPESMVHYCVSPCNLEGHYLYSNGSCFSTCKAPLVAVFEYGVRYCRNPCKMSSDYLYANSSCFTECPAPLEARTEPIANFCVNPCHSESLYLYNNGSCLSNCLAPLVAVFDPLVRYCRSPCFSESDYLYFNRSCFKECPAPLQIIAESAANFCINPCQSENLYLYQNGSCFPACKAPLEVVLNHGVRFCRNPCQSASDYLYADRSCLKECPAPLKVRSESIANYCINPCANLNLYLYSNGSCLSTCSFPLKIREEFGVKYCEPPCSLTREYILRHGACSKECPAPLIQKIEASVGTFCLSPCHDLFIVKNGSCSLDCPAYFETKIEYGMNYCFSPCGVNQYYYHKNRSCLERCPDPFQVKYEAGAKICQAPCSGFHDFIYDDQLCYESCPTPLKIEVPNYCKSPCLKENEYLNSNGDCQETCAYPDGIVKKGPYKICMIGLRKAQSAQFLAMREIIKISSTVSWVGGVLSCLMDGGDPTSILMTPALKMFQRIIYTDIELPGNTELILNHHGERKLSSKIIIEVRFQIVLLVSFSLLAFLISILLKRVRFSNESKFHQILIKCDLTLRLNTLIPLFISVNGDILLSSVIDLQNPRSILCILLTIFRLGQIYKNSRRRREEVEMARWRFLFEVFSENQKFFILIYFVRIIVYHLIIGLLYDYPQLQAFSMMVLSFVMCFYLIWGAPVKKIISKIQYFVVELALLFYNFIFGILAIFDFKESSVADVLGQLMNILYLITSVITAFIIVVKILHIIYHNSQAWSSLANSQSGHIQLSEMNQENDLDSPPESVRFEPLNQVEVGSENENNFDDDFIEPSVAIE